MWIYCGQDWARRSSHELVPPRLYLASLKPFFFKRHHDRLSLLLFSSSPAGEVAPLLTHATV